MILQKNPASAAAGIVNLWAILTHVKHHYQQCAWLLGICLAFGIVIPYQGQKLSTSIDQRTVFQVKFAPDCQRSQGTELEIHDHHAPASAPASAPATHIYQHQMGRLGSHGPSSRPIVKAPKLRGNALYSVFRPNVLQKKKKKVTWIV